MKAAFYTLGCKVNQCETEYITELFKKDGYEIVNYTDTADIYVINSCTVTATADQKTRQSIRKFKRNHPESIVILTGCMPPVSYTHLYQMTACFLYRLLFFLCCFYAYKLLLRQKRLQ